MDRHLYRLLDGLWQFAAACFFACASQGSFNLYIKNECNSFFAFIFGEIHI